MSAGSLSSYFGLGPQSAQGTASTKVFKTLATVSGMQPQFDVSDSRLEHPGGTGSRNTSKKSVSARTGYLVPFKSTFIARGNFLPIALRAAGFSIATTNNSGYYTHVCTWAASNAVPWVSAFWYVAASDNPFTVRSVDARVTKLSLNATPTEIQCDLEGKGMSEGDATGSETATSEVTYEILPTIGSVTVQSGGADIATTFRSANTEITQELIEDDRTLFQATRADLPQKSIGATITLGGIDITRDFYRKLFRGSTSGTAASLTPLTGNVTMNFQSSAFITGSTPWSITIAAPSVEFAATDNNFQAQNDEQIRCELVASIIDDVTTPLTITVVNNVSSYAP